jgi:hypothetical protein
LAEGVYNSLYCLRRSSLGISCLVFVPAMPSSQANGGYDT